MKDFLLKDEAKNTVYFFYLYHNLFLGNPDKIMTNWEKGAGSVNAKAVHIEDKEAAVSVRVDNLESRMVSIESKVDDRSMYLTNSQEILPT